jgi:hypothetical protein
MAGTPPKDGLEPYAACAESVAVTRKVKLWQCHIEDLINANNIRLISWLPVTTDFEIMRPEKDIADAGYELGDGAHES